MRDAIRERAAAFCEAYGLDIPILMAPMAGASPVRLAAAVATAGGMGALGATSMEPEALARWSAEFRAATDRPLQINLWTPDPDPPRDADHEAAVFAFLSDRGVTPGAPDAPSPSFADQCDALIEARPAVMSSIMGLFPDAVVERAKGAGIRWFACATTVAEAVAAEAAGADAIVAQGAEAGGHRGAFDQAAAERQMIGLFSLLPAVADAVRVPVIATGGIGDARGVVAALALGASAVQVGTALLRAPEAGIAPTWANAIEDARAEDTVPTRAFSGRLGRSLPTAYVKAVQAADAPAPLPFPLQRAVTGPMRAAAARNDNLDGISAWAGQSAGLARALPAAEIVRELWAQAAKL